VKQHLCEKKIQGKKRRGGGKGREKQKEKKKRKEKKRTGVKKKTFWRQLNEKPSFLPGCPEHLCAVLQHPNLTFQQHLTRRCHTPGTHKLEQQASGAGLDSDFALTQGLQ